MSYYNGRKTANFIMGKGTVLDITQTTGDSETKVMSQKAVTDELNNMESHANNTFCGALKPTVTGVGAVRLDGVSPIQHQIDVSFETVNLINQEEFFATEVGGVYAFDFDEHNYSKKYFFNAKIKKGVDLTGVSVTIGREVFGTDLFIETYDIISNGVVNTMSIEIQNETVDNFVLSDVRIVVIDAATNDCHPTLKLSDIFESVSMVLDVNEVGITSYGKNLFNVNQTWGRAGTAGHVVELFVPSDCVVSINTQGVYGATDFQRAYVIQKTTVDDDDWTNKTNVGTLVNYSTPHKAVFIAREEGYKYRIWTNDSAYADHILSAQLEVGAFATTHEEYKKPVEGAEVIYPTTTWVSNVEGTNFTVTYNKDINVAIAELQNAILNVGGIL